MTPSSTFALPCADLYLDLIPHRTSSMPSPRACWARRLLIGFGIAVGLGAFPAEAHGQG